MPVNDVAFAASVGAIGLSLSAAAWAWRFRRRALGALARAEAEAQGLREDMLALKGGADAFDTCLISLDPERIRAVSGGWTLSACARALQVDEARLSQDPDGAAEEMVSAIAASSPEHAERIAALIQEGEPCRFNAAGLEVDGRATGGVAWLRLRPVGAQGGLSENGASGGDVAERLPMPAWRLDAADALTWANPAFLAASEQPDLEAVRANGGFGRNAEALAAEARRSGEPRQGFRWITVGGKRKAWRLGVQPLEAGEVLAWAEDVTEAEEIRETLKRQVKAHDETLDRLDDAVLIFGPGKRLVFHNRAFQQSFGLEAAWLDERPTHGEILDRLRQRRRLPEVADYGAWKAAELDLYGASGPFADETWTLPDGRTLRLARQPDPRGGLVLLFSDITDELKLRAQYNALIQVQRATLDKLNDAVAVFGSDGRLRLHNEAFERFWRAGGPELSEAADFEGVSALCRRLLPEPTLWAELKGRVADPDPHARVPVSGEARTNDRRTVAWQTRPLPDGATLVAFSDITATRELEKALAQREAALSEAETLKREFVGNVSYELRTPLTTIIGYAELMESQGEALPERTRPHVAAIKSAAMQLARSVDDVLDMAQIDAGEMALSLGDVSVEELIAGAARRLADRAQAKAVTVFVTCAPDCGLIRADALRLGQALDQLGDNALRAAPQGSQIELAAERTQGEVRIHVKDRGRGIPFHVQAHIFDRFTARERGGPGLGLALVKALVEMHGGWVALESEPGHGAVFTLHLPEQAAQGAAEPELDLPAAGARA
ncbi:ATP-binding protein [Brevundimonas sp. 2R-24]|uniref:histidine kinase n=1 Tax=Peiella sedimenti TaxID=3061083 RepID=A0ABT8SKN5_9CAUL|nr:ATP-binding protein [Caulobacteraceae bacterium XZ-24]